METLERSQKEIAVEGDELPLVVDLDGTYTPVDTLHESLVKLFKVKPLAAFNLFCWLSGGKAKFKQMVSANVTIDASLLPVDRRVRDRIDEERRKGRRIVLATASYIQTAESVASQAECFDDVVATDGEVNNAGAAKRDALVARYGEGRFDYIGNGGADVPVWAASRKAILVNASKSLIAQARTVNSDVEVLSERQSQTWPLIKAARPYQWVKNLLIFIPVIASQQITIENLTYALIAFFCFSIAASSVYLVNDICDLEADRRHPRKRNRPFASGHVPVLSGGALAAMLVLLSGLGALLLDTMFALVLLIYLFFTLNYSFWIKRYALLDVVVLAGLYTMRIIAGGVATDIYLTLWLLGFSMFLFSSLAFAKRYSEVAELLRTEKSSTPGRGYQGGDQHVLMALGTSTGIASVLTLALYVNSKGETGLYDSPEHLWAACPLLLYWISRIWIAAQREKLSDDPIVFSFNDKGSRAVFILTLLVFASSL